MDYKEKATILRVCSSKKGERCSLCPAFGQGDRNCKRNAMAAGAEAITRLIEEVDGLRADNIALKAAVENYQDRVVPMYKGRAESAEELIAWIYKEARLASGSNVRMYLDWITDRIGEWNAKKEG